MIRTDANLLPCVPWCCRAALPSAETALVSSDAQQPFSPKSGWFQAIVFSPRSKSFLSSGPKHTFIFLRAILLKMGQLAFLFVSESHCHPMDVFFQISTIFLTLFWNDYRVLAVLWTLLHPVSTSGDILGLESCSGLGTSFWGPHHCPQPGSPRRGDTIGW